VMLVQASCQMHLGRSVSGMNPARDPSWFVVVHTAYRIKTRCEECDSPALWLVGLENRRP
jgi:hypothetical protein